MNSSFAVKLSSQVFVSSNKTIKLLFKLKILAGNNFNMLIQWSDLGVEVGIIVNLYWIWVFAHFEFLSHASNSIFSGIKVDRSVIDLCRKLNIFMSFIANFVLETIIFIH